VGAILGNQKNRKVYKSSILWENMLFDIDNHTFEEGFYEKGTTNKSLYYKVFKERNQFFAIPCPANFSSSISNNDPLKVVYDNKVLEEISNAISATSLRKINLPKRLKELEETINFLNQ